MNDIKKINNLQLETLLHYLKINFYNPSIIDKINIHHYISIEHFLQTFTYQRNKTLLYSKNVQDYRPIGLINKYNNAFIYFPVPIENINKYDYQRYIKRMHLLIHNLAKSKPNTWIIDLRNNTGGDYTFFLACFYPLFKTDGLIGSDYDKYGNKVHDYSIYNGRVETYRYDKNIGYGSEKSIVSIDKFIPTKKISNSTKVHNIAVLINNNTASAAELLSLKFKNDGAKFYGKKSACAGTGIYYIEIKDDVPYIDGSSKNINSAQNNITIIFPFALLHDKQNNPTECIIPDEKHIPEEYWPN